jgi:catechol 2,3-dioxygenase-like lactoylglutathione lyase family enzyme
VTLGVRDLARAKGFYEALGWRGALQPDDEIAFFQAGGMVFGLWTALGGLRGTQTRATSIEEPQMWSAAESAGQFDWH